MLPYFYFACPDKDSSDDDHLDLLRLPFSSSDPLNSLSAAIGGIEQIDFPHTISKSASSLIKKLCRYSNIHLHIHSANSVMKAQFNFYIHFAQFSDEKSYISEQNHSRLLDKKIFVLLFVAFAK